MVGVNRAARLAVSLVVAVLVVGLGSCTPGEPGTSPGSPAVVSSSGSSSVITPVSVPSGRLASSLSALFQQYANRSDATEQERNVLLHASVVGSISALDYERVFASYTSCMLEHGIDFAWVKDSAGVYYTPVIDHTKVTFSDAAYEAADQECQTLMYVVQWAYQIQQSNPDLLSDPAEAVVACLRRKGVVDASYTAQDFTQQQANYVYGSSFPFDPYKGDAFACLIAQGYGYIPG